MTTENREVSRKKLRRLRILQALQLNYPQPITEKLVSQTLSDESDLHLTTIAMRQELDYLHELSLIRREVEDDVWCAKLLPMGVDYLDGLGDDLNGVARP
ncbi:MAG: hypothetical protein PHP00_06715 [Thiotrichaceae bacterium]|nr:hypothetical protein [Thiotrichaceae bacterium]